LILLKKLCPMKSDCRLGFSAWEDDRKFDDMFRRLIDGLELFYKG